MQKKKKETKKRNNCWSKFRIFVAIASSLSYEARIFWRSSGFFWFGLRPTCLEMFFNWNTL